METFRCLQHKKQKSCFNKYFILLFYGAKLNLFHTVRSPPADALPSLFGTPFVLARKAWDWTGILRCHVFFGSGIAVLEKGNHRW
jgi:hypothetical protein